MIIGSCIVNIAAFMTMILVIRHPPEYPGDEERTNEAKWLFSFLVIMHAFMAFVKIHALYFSDYWWPKMTLFMICTMIMTIWL